MIQPMDTDYMSIAQALCDAKGCTLSDKRGRMYLRVSRHVAAWKRSARNTATMKQREAYRECKKYVYSQMGSIETILLWWLINWAIREILDWMIKSPIMGRFK